MSRQQSKIEITKHLEIKHRLKEIRISLRCIAELSNCTPSYVTMVSQGRRKNRIVAENIASILGQLPEQIWPDIYPPNRPQTESDPMK